MTRLYLYMCRIIIILLAVLLICTEDAQALEGFLPDDLQISVLVQPKDLPGEFRDSKNILQINEVGQPTLLMKDTFLTLKNRADQKVIPPFKVAGVTKIDHYAWMHDGALLMIVGRKLGGLTMAGFEPILSLPAAGMKVQPAAADLCYLYGGDTDVQRRHLYLYKKGGRLLHLLDAAEPITAVAGNGNTTFAALGDAVFALISGHPAFLIYTAEETITSLTLVMESGGILYTTPNHAGYIHAPGSGFAFISKAGVEVKAFQNDLYILLPDKGLLRATPLSSFEKLAATMKAVEKAPLPPAAQHAINRGLAAAERQHWQEAIDRFSEARKFAPDALQTLFNLALVTDKNGNELSAIGWYQAYIAGVTDATTRQQVQNRTKELMARVERKVWWLINLAKDNAVIFEQTAPADFVAAGNYMAIIRAQTILGDIAGAKQTAQYVPESLVYEGENICDLGLCRSAAYGEIVAAQIIAGDFAGAQETIEQVNDERFKSSATGDILKTLLGLGYFSTLQKMADSQVDSATTYTLADGLVKTLLGLGYFGTLQKMADSQADSLITYTLADDLAGYASKTIAYLIVAEAKAKAGDLTGAKEIITIASELASSIKNKDYKLAIYRRLLQVQLEAGDIASALQSADLYKTSTGYEPEYAAIARAQAEAGDYEGALTTSAKIKSDWIRSYVNMDISKVQARAGKLTPAFRTARDHTSLWPMTATALAIVAENCLHANKPKAAHTIIEGCFTRIIPPEMWEKKNIEENEVGDLILDTYLVIASTQIKMGNMKEAQALIGRFEFSESQKKRVLISLAETYFTVGEFEMGREVLTQVAALASKSKSDSYKEKVFHEIAKLQSKAGNTLEAEMATAMAERYNWVRFTLGKLSEPYLVDWSGFIQSIKDQKPYDTAESLSQTSEKIASLYITLKGMVDEGAK